MPVPVGSGSTQVRLSLGLGALYARSAHDRFRECEGVASPPWSERATGGVDFGALVPILLPAFFRPLSDDLRITNLRVESHPRLGSPSRRPRFWKAINKWDRDLDHNCVCAPCRSTHPTSRAPPPSARCTMVRRATPAPALSLLDDVGDTFDTLEEALQCVAPQKNRIISYIRSLYKHSSRGHKMRHAQHKMSTEQVGSMVDMAQIFSVNNMVLTVEQNRQLVGPKYHVRGSRQWSCRCVGRHRRRLRRRACKALADKRMEQEAFDGVVDVFTKLEDFLAHSKSRDRAVFNYGDTGFVQNGEDLVLRRIQAAKKERADVRSTIHHVVSSLLSFMAIDGTGLLSVSILKGPSREGDLETVNLSIEKALRVTRKTWPRFYVCNDVGYLDADIFKSALGKVAEEFHGKYPWLSALLYGDQLAVRSHADPVDFALLLGLFLFTLKKSTSYTTHPLDEAPFATLQEERVRRMEAAVIDGVLIDTDS